MSVPKLRYTGEFARPRRGCDAMAERLGWALYWIAVGIAALLALGGTAAVLISRPDPFGSIILFVLAALVWGLGRLIRYVLARE